MFLTVATFGFLLWATRTQDLGKLLSCPSRVPRGQDSWLTLPEAKKGYCSGWLSLKAGTRMHNRVRSKVEEEYPTVC